MWEHKINMTIQNEKELINFFHIYPRSQKGIITSSSQPPPTVCSWHTQDRLTMALMNPRTDEHALISIIKWTSDSFVNSSGVEAGGNHINILNL